MARHREWKLEDIEEAGEAYLLKCEPELIDEIGWVRKERPTLTGLALSFGMNRRQTLYDYEGYEEFSDTIKGFRLRIENYYEQCITDPDQKPAGAIFALKNLGWSDKQEIEHSFDTTVIDRLREKYENK